MLLQKTVLFHRLKILPPTLNPPASPATKSRAIFLAHPATAANRARFR